MPSVTRNTLILLCLLIAGLSAQNNFDANSDYFERGRFSLVSSGVMTPLKGYRPLPSRTIAVNPQKIIPGAVLYIPQLAGAKLTDGSVHDGYFFAHALMSADGNNELAVYRWQGVKPLPGKVTVFRVYGVMEKAARTRFELSYRVNRPKPVYEMVAGDLDTLLRSRNKKIKKLSERIEYYSALGKGTPYAIYNLGEGADAPIDPDPTIDLARVDCMTFCENTLAMSLADSYKAMYDSLQNIRYKNGTIEYTHRNHYTIADWLPNNSRFLYDATGEIGGNKLKPMTKTIDRPGFYKKAGVPDSIVARAAGRETLTVHYIPTAALKSIIPRLKGGEIVSIVSTFPGIVSAHMGIVVRDEWGNVTFRHASSSKSTHEVTDVRFEDYVDMLSRSKTRVGMIFMRVREHS